MNMNNINRKVCPLPHRPDRVLLYHSPRNPRASNFEELKVLIDAIREDIEVCIRASEEAVEFSN